jgi:crotonobetainyl-CoA:carnitine CoA-transferase CaiB-like acyl-CoA transferase
MAEPNRPLSGIRVLDLGMITAGASASALLADLGADVMKVESGGAIDLFRTWDGRTPGVDWWNRSRFFRFTNRNKRGIGIDLKSPDGRTLFLRLVEQADVVLENFRRGVLERLKLSFADLLAVNPRIILASITSQGEHGPDRAAASYGSTLDATSGLASISGYPDGMPVISGIALNYPDQIISIFAAGVVVAAVLERRQTGKGIHLDIPQRELASFLIGERIVADDQTRLGNGDDTAGAQDCVHSADGVWLVVRAADATTLPAPFDAWAAVRTAADVIADLAARGIRATPVADGHGLHDAVVAAGDCTAFARDPAGDWAKGFPFQFRERAMRVTRPAPGLGEHTAEVLRELLDLSDAEIAALDASGATSILPTA